MKTFRNCAPEAFQFDNLRLREMKGDHHEIQTPKNNHTSISSNRKAKSMNVQSKKQHNQQQKSVKRNLNYAFTPISDVDAVLDSSEESIEKISSISEAVDADQSTLDIGNTNLDSDHTLVSDNTLAVQTSGESVGISSISISESFISDEDQLSSIESYIASLNQHISPSAGSLEVTPLSSKRPAETTPLSSITTVEMTPLSQSLSPITADAAAVFVNSVTNDGFTTKAANSVKLESLVKHLRESMIQVLNPTDIEPQYNKLLDALVKIVSTEFLCLHEERGLFIEQFSKKVKLLLLSCLLGMLAVSAGFFIFSDAQNAYHGPLPT